MTVWILSKTSDAVNAQFWYRKKSKTISGNGSWLGTRSWVIDRDTVVAKKLKHINNAPTRVFLSSRGYGVTPCRFLLALGYLSQEIIEFKPSDSKICEINK